MRVENFSRTFLNRRKDGEVYHAVQSISALRDAKHHITHYVSISKDISDLVQREQELCEQAYYDDLYRQRPQAKSGCVGSSMSQISA